MSFQITVFGIISNSYVFFASQQMTSMNSSFGTITKYQTICNSMMCLCFLSFVPFQLGAFKSYIPITHWVGTTAMISDEISYMCHLLIALNRFFSLYLASFYELVFSVRNTKRMILVIWIVSIIVCTILYEFVGCLYPYNERTLSLQFLDTPMCDHLTWFSDFMLNISFAVVTVTINFLTAFKAMRSSRMLVNAAGLQISKQQKQREMNFIRQTFFQGLTVSTGQISYYVLAPHVSNEVALFFLTSLWGFVHAFEGTNYAHFHYNVSLKVEPSL
ncbi:Protein CBG01413 [Caenorhabditis briggsae]|uniref:Protein CBG01413 n=2 Tax=Caenorhabditis briggsae TaxID=6238 RepID=A8WQC9_CAEBR|nr:Protein CBG01413 [Caenorhabditis briggsae]CAP22687.2 Protein CBG01413 [Caenorhabditis briggsae]